MTLRIFPVSGGATYSDDWMAPRSDGRSHLGNDLFNKEGTPLLAVDDGQIRYGEDGLGGHVANLYAQDGTRYYYAHQSAFEGGPAPRQVKAGDVIGYMGHTGNAANTPTHLHFEVHPNNSGPSGAIDPYPLLKKATVQSGASPSTSTNKVAVGLLLGAAAIGLWSYADPSSFNRLSHRIMRIFT
jgi:murein DD-endopeptidase MepM/ murein hydrolase activator NlpD